MGVRSHLTPTAKKGTTQVQETKYFNAWKWYRA